MWGQHLIIDLAGGKLEAIQSADVIAKFSRDLVQAIDMKAYGEPLLAHFADHLPKAVGWTLVQLIETSSITGHFCDITGDAYLDVFSCKEFDVQTVIDLVEEVFEPENLHTTLLMRQAGRRVTQPA
jgi:S-adenosylmethionine/arginine decarboxylase-like enzyme